MLFTGLLDTIKPKLTYLSDQLLLLVDVQIGSLSDYYIQDLQIPIVSSHKDLSVLVDSSLRFHLHIKSIVSKASGLSANLLRSTKCRTRSFMVSLLISHIRPLLEFASCVWNTGFIGDLHLLESVQRTWIRHIARLSHLSYEE